MRKSWLSLCLLALTICVSGSALAESSDFQTGKIIDVETLAPSSTPSGGTDAPVASDVSRYNVSIQLADSVYVCRAKTSSAFDLTWAKGKDVPAKVKGNVMYVKRANGRCRSSAFSKRLKLSNDSISYKRKGCHNGSRFANPVESNSNIDAVWQWLPVLTVPDTPSQFHTRSSKI
jgi:hypothetical protein